MPEQSQRPQRKVRNISSHTLKDGSDIFKLILIQYSHVVWELLVAVIFNMSLQQSELDNSSPGSRVEQQQTHTGRPERTRSLHGCWYLHACIFTRMQRCKFASQPVSNVFRSLRSHRVEVNGRRMLINSSAHFHSMWAKGWKTFDSRGGSKFSYLNWGWTLVNFQVNISAAGDAHCSAFVHVRRRCKSFKVHVSINEY